MKFNRQHGRAYKAKEVREFELFLFEWADKQKKLWEENNREAWPMDKKYFLQVDVVYGTKHKFDIQNVFDTICDAMEGVFYEDDSQIIAIKGSKAFEAKIDKFTITLSVL